MFNFFQNIFDKVISLTASVIIAVGLVSMPPTPEMAVVQNPLQSSQNEEIVAPEEKIKEPIKQVIKKEESGKQNVIPAVSAVPVIPPSKPKPTSIPIPSPTSTPIPTPTPTLTHTPTSTPASIPMPTPTPTPTSVPLPTPMPTSVPVNTPSVQSDIVPPIISNIRTSIKLQSSPTTDSIIIEWSTNEPTLGKVNFGGNMSCSVNGCEDAYSSFGIFKQGESYELNHQMIINNDFKPATEYKYYIYATDKTGNETGFYDGKIATEPSVPLPELKGQYNIDIILTKDKSPYTITGDVFINKKLQIEPGVEIKFNGAYNLVVNREFGEIHVSGTKGEPVSFNFANLLGNGRGIFIRSNNNNVIDNAIIEFADTRAISIDSWKNGVRANAVILNCTIQNNPVGIWINNSAAKITDSLITKNGTGVHSVFNSRVEMYQNDFFDNSNSAFSLETGTIPQLKFNNILDPIRIHAHPDLAVAVFTQNNIEGSVTFGSQSTSEIWNSAKGEINAQNNWWGTTDIPVISQRIKEYNNVFFNYQPVATSEIQNAGIQ